MNAESKLLEIRCYWDEGGKEHGLALRDQLWLLEHSLASEAAAYERAAQTILAPVSYYRDECEAAEYAIILEQAAEEVRKLASPSGQPAPHEHKWRTIYGDPATGKPQIEACDICNQERAEYWQPVLAALKAEVRPVIKELEMLRNGLKKGVRDEFSRGAITALESCISELETLAAPPPVTQRTEAEIRREEAQWWADEQVEKDGELSATGAIRLAEIDAAVTRGKE